MTTAQTVLNPFALMMDPASIFAAIERSDALTRLQSRVCRPLDKPQAPRADRESAANDGRSSLPDRDDL